MFKRPLTDVLYSIPVQDFTMPHSKPSACTCTVRFNIATTTTHQRVRLTVYDTQKCVNAAIFSDKSTVGNMFKRVSN